MPQYYAKTVFLNTAQGETTFVIDFQYQSQDDVVVTINGVETTDFTWTSPSTISLNTGTQSGDDISIARRTDLSSRAVDFQNAAELTEADLDASAQQVFDATQESADIVADSFTPQPDGSLSLTGRRLGDVGTPVSPSDAVNKQYVDERITFNETFRDETIAARDVTLAARDETLTFKGEAETSRNGAEFFAGQSETVFNDLTLLINNLDAQTILPALPSNALKLLQVSSDATSTEWVDISGYTGLSQYYLKTEANTAFLAINAAAADSALLGGRDDYLLPDGDASVSAAYSFDKGIHGTFESTSNWGSSIWSLSDAYAGSASGEAYSPSNQFGLSWVRTGITPHDSKIGEGMYLYLNGVLKGGIGGSGIYTAGDVYAAGDVTAFSDVRLKCNFTPLLDPINKVKKLNGLKYDRKDIDLTQNGLIAQDVQKVLPESVKEDDNGTLSVAYNGVVALLVEAVKELTERVEELENAATS